MKIIDANTGQEVRTGDTFRNVSGVHTILAVQPGLFSAKAEVRSQFVPGWRCDPGPVTRWLPLTVRWTHPSFFGQHVAFIES
jgi:hypothetical protein